MSECERSDLVLVLLDDEPEADELAEAEAHLAGCAACREQLEGYRRTARAVQELPAEQPGEAARAQAYAAVLEAMRQRPAQPEPADQAAGERDRADAPRGSLLRWGPLFAAAACLLLVVSVAVQPGPSRPSDGVAARPTPPPAPPATGEPATPSPPSPLPADEAPGAAGGEGFAPAEALLESGEATPAPAQGRAFAPPPSPSAQPPAPPPPAEAPDAPPPPLPPRPAAAVGGRGQPAAPEASDGEADADERAAPARADGLAQPEAERARRLNDALRRESEPDGVPPARDKLRDAEALGDAGAPGGSKAGEPMPPAPPGAAPRGGEAAAKAVQGGAQPGWLAAWSVGEAVYALDDAGRLRRTALPRPAGAEQRSQDPSAPRDGRERFGAGGAPRPTGAEPGPNAPGAGANGQQRAPAPPPALRLELARLSELPPPRELEVAHDASAVDDVERILALELAAPTQDEAWARRAALLLHALGEPESGPEQGAELLRLRMVRRLELRHLDDLEAKDAQLERAAPAAEGR